VNPRDPLWHLPTRPRVANLIDELPDSISDREARVVIEGYVDQLKDHGLKLVPTSVACDGYPSFYMDGPILRALLLAAYLDGRRDEEADAKLRPVFAAVADALPPVGHEAEARLDVTLAEHRAREIKRPLR